MYNLQNTGIINLHITCMIPRMGIGSCRNVEIWSGNNIIAVTDDNGNASINIPEGANDLILLKRRFEPYLLETNITANQTIDIPIQLISMPTSLGMFHLIIIDSDRNPISGAEININGFRFITDKFGTVIIKNLLNGYNYNITVGAENYQIFNTTIALIAGLEREIIILLPKIK